jgi:hypothetical protein
LEKQEIEKLKREGEKTSYRRSCAQSRGSHGVDGGKERLTLAFPYLEIILVRACKRIYRVKSKISQHADRVSTHAHAHSEMRTYAKHREHGEQRDAYEEREVMCYPPSLFEHAVLPTG